jgi:hypothetical protein
MGLKQAIDDALDARLAARRLDDPAVLLNCLAVRLELEAGHSCSVKPGRPSSGSSRRSRRSRGAGDFWRACQQSSAPGA